MGIFSIMLPRVFPRVISILKGMGFIMSNTLINSSLLSFGIWKGSGAVSVKIDEDFDNFRYLSIYDNVANTRNIVEKTKYTVAPGSTVITLKESFLETLAGGTYYFHARFIDGNVKLELTVDRCGSVSAPKDVVDAVPCCFGGKQDDDDEDECCCGFDISIEDCRKLAFPIAILAFSVLIYAGIKYFQKSKKS